MYLSGNGVSFLFKHSKINKIENNDIEISDDIYNKFFEEQAKGKNFKVKNKSGQTFDEIFEEVPQDVI